MEPKPNSIYPHRKIKPPYSRPTLNGTKRLERWVKLRKAEEKTQKVVFLHDPITLFNNPSMRCTWLHCGNVIDSKHRLYEILREYRNQYKSYPDIIITSDGAYSPIDQPEINGLTWARVYGIKTRNPQGQEGLPNVYKKKLLHVNADHHHPDRLLNGVHCSTFNLVQLVLQTGLFDGKSEFEFSDNSGQSHKIGGDNSPLEVVILHENHTIAIDPDYTGPPILFKLVERYGIQILNDQNLQDFLNLLDVFDTHCGNPPVDHPLFGGSAQELLDGFRIYQTVFVNTYRMMLSIIPRNSLNYNQFIETVIEADLERLEEFYLYGKEAWLKKIEAEKMNYDDIFRPNESPVPFILKKIFYAGQEIMIKVSNQSPRPRPDAGFLARAANVDITLDYKGPVAQNGEEMWTLTQLSPYHKDPQKEKIRHLVREILAKVLDIVWSQNRSIDGPVLRGGDVVSGTREVGAGTDYDEMINVLDEIFNLIARFVHQSNELSSEEIAKKVFQYLSQTKEYHQWIQTQCEKKIFSRLFDSNL